MGMKLLFLSLCGRENEDEDVRYLNLYLASLRRHVIPHFDTRVLLFSTFNAKERTQARIDAFGLTPYIDVRRIDDMGLPEETRVALQRLNHFPKIGIHMNMLFDYAKQQNFFDADWVFHTDTDIEFLDNFLPHITALETLRSLNPKIFVSCAGDSYPAFIRYKDEEYCFHSPKRWSVYTEPYSHDMFNMDIIARKTRRVWHPSQLGETLVFEPEHLKIRNDFVGMSRATAEMSSFNWIGIYGGLSTKLAHNSPNPPRDLVRVAELWDQHESQTPLPLRIGLQRDKGGAFLYDIKNGEGQFTWIQLRGYVDMAKHYSSGWEQQNRQFIERSHAILHEQYTDSISVWQDDVAG